MRPFIGWTYILLVIGSVGNGFLIYEAISMFFLRGAALAQADFELFLVFVLIGIPALVISLFCLFAFRRRPAGAPAEPLPHRVGLALCYANLCVAVGVFGLLAVLKTQGIFWL